MRTDKTGQYAAARGLAVAIGLVAAAPVAAQQAAPGDGTFATPSAPIPPIEQAVDEVDQPPVPESRWHPPQPPATWSGLPRTS